MGRVVSKQKPKEEVVQPSADNTDTTETTCVPDLGDWVTEIIYGSSFNEDIENWV